MKKSGLSIEELFKRGEELSYDDFTIIDTMYTDIETKDISLEVELMEGFVLKTPIIASPMDTVTNANLGIAIALEGGIAVMHYNHKNSDGSPDLDAQEAEVRRVKRYENGMIKDPVTVSPSDTIADVIKKSEESRVGKSMIDTFPVTYRGMPHGKLMGLLRKQDYSRSIHTNVKVKDRMVSSEKLVTGKSPISLSKANDMLWDNRLLYLPIVDEEGHLESLVTRIDLDKNEEYPIATKDEQKRLRVLFAVETRDNPGYERLERCFSAGADGCVIDTSQGFTRYETDMAEYILTKYPGKLVIGGNIGTAEGFSKLNNIGVHAARIGQGSGSICTTAGAIGVSRAAASAIYDCASTQGAMKCIADGGIRQVGDIVKALSSGAYAVMLGSMLAGTEEGPGEVVPHPETGIPVKIYRGMGSKEAMGSGNIRGYHRLAQGVSDYTKYKGSIHTWIPLIRDGIISGLHTQNSLSIKDLHEKVYTGEIRFGRRSAASIAESKPHIRNG